MKAIETVYRNIRFRSRSEAKWAILMDQLGVEFDYEPEGYQMDSGLRYLPDFYLRDQKIWAEVKADRPNEIEIEKARRLTTESGLPLAFLIFATGRHDAIEWSGGPFYVPGQMERHPYLSAWHCCIWCDAWSIVPYAYCAGFECWQCKKKWTADQVQELTERGREFFDMDLLKDPFTVARQARFEFGETPRGLPPVDREGV